MIHEQRVDQRSVVSPGCVLAMILIAAALMSCREAKPGAASVNVQVADDFSGLEPVDFTGGSYRGTLPCASCSGVKTNIDFRDDLTYLRKRTYEDVSDGADSISFDLGRWILFSTGRLVLTDNRGGTTRFSIVNSKEIRLVDPEGMPIDSETNLSLRAARGGMATFGPTVIRGMYTYFADASIFKPCHTDATIPVAMVEHHVDLEQAYLENRSGAGAPLYVEMVARIEAVPAMEGDGLEEALVVSKVRTVYPGESCFDESVLTDSLRWILHSIDGIPIVREHPNRLPSLTLGVDRITGSTGCNRLSGTFEVSDGGFRVGPLVTTRRACPDTLEAAFLALLGTVESHRVYGDQLQLRSTDGPVAILNRVRE